MHADILRIYFLGLPSNPAKAAAVRNGYIHLDDNQHSMHWRRNNIDQWVSWVKENIGKRAGDQASF